MHVCQVGKMRLCDYGKSMHAKVTELDFMESSFSVVNSGRCLSTAYMRWKNRTQALQRTAFASKFTIVFT